MRSNKVTIPCLLAAFAAMAVICITAGGGSLEPASPPGPTMHSLDELYNLTGSIGTDQIIGPLGIASVRGNAYLQVSNLPGESKDPAHLNWIDIVWASNNISLPAITSQSAVGGGHSGTRANFSDFAVIKEIDKSSPKLYEYCCNSKQIPLVKLECCRATGDKSKYMTYEMRDVVVSAVEPVYSHRTGGEYIHLEKVSFRFAEMHWEYKTATGETTQAGWSMKTNKKM